MNIKWLCIGIGYVESTKMATLLVEWRGVPFKESQDAINHFVDSCFSQCEGTVRLPECCAKQLVLDPSSRYCPKDGNLLVATRKISFKSYLQGLFDSDNDNFERTAYRFNDPPDEVQNGDAMLNGWYFGSGFPTDGDVVVIHGLDVEDRIAKSKPFWRCSIVSLG